MKTVNELELMEKKELRDEMLGRIEVLDKVKEVTMLPCGDVMTIGQLIEYFEVEKEMFKSAIKRNREELSKNGMRILEKEELKEFKARLTEVQQSLTEGQKKPQLVGAKARSLGIFTRRAILNLAMLLESSEVAKEIRNQLLNVAEEKETTDKIVHTIDEETMLMVGVCKARTDEERMIALSKLNAYKQAQLDKVEGELEVATTKVNNLTDSDVTMGLREAKNNLGVKETQLKNYLLDKKYIYRQVRLKPTAQYTKEPTRYFTEIMKLDRYNREYKQMVFTIQGLEFFREKTNEINSYKTK